MDTQRAEREGFLRTRLLLNAHPEWIEEAHKLGLDVNVWTVNKEAEIDKFFDRGVDKVTTDIPAVYKK